MRRQFCNHQVELNQQWRALAEAIHTHWPPSQVHPPALVRSHKQWPNSPDVVAVGATTDSRTPHQHAVGIQQPCRESINHWPTPPTAAPPTRHKHSSRTGRTRLTDRHLTQQCNSAMNGPTTATTHTLTQPQQRNEWPTHSPHPPHQPSHNRTNCATRGRTLQAIHPSTNTCPRGAHSLTHGRACLQRSECRGCKV